MSSGTVWRTVEADRALLRRHKILSLILFAIVVTIEIHAAIGENHAAQATAYLLAIGFSVFAVDLFVMSRSLPYEDFNIKNPKKEIKFILFSVVAVSATLFSRFVLIPDWNTVTQLVRVLFLPFLILFIYPIFLLIVFLIMKYKLRDFGVRWNGILLSFPVILFLATAALSVSPESIQWERMYQQVGISGLLYLGFLSAAIPEEFLRMLFQTRLSAVLNRPAVGWFVASLFWALMHLPKFYSQNNDFWDAFFSSIHILPIGLLWGYMTYRTKSILPSVLVHATNLWGLT